MWIYPMRSYAEIHSGVSKLTKLKGVANKQPTVIEQTKVLTDWSDLMKTNGFSRFNEHQTRQNSFSSGLELDTKCDSKEQVRLEIKENQGNFAFSQAKIEQVVEVKHLKLPQKSVKVIQDKITNPSFLLLRISLTLDRKPNVPVYFSYKITTILLEI